MVSKVVYHNMSLLYDPIFWIFIVVLDQDLTFPEKLLIDM